MSWESDNNNSVGESVGEGLSGQLSSVDFDMQTGSMQEEGDDSKPVTGFAAVMDRNKLKRLSLDKYLIKNEAATFFMKAASRSMTDFGIYPGDILIINRALPLKNGLVGVFIVNGELILRRYVENHSGEPSLVANPNARIREVISFEGSNCELWGVVTHSVRNLKDLAR